MKTWCSYCDPKYFVIYGFCSNCKRRCEPPLFYPEGPVHVSDYETFCKKWNEERSDLIIDAMRRTSNDQMGHEDSIGVFHIGNQLIKTIR